ncbi:DUF1836 domain-containing protein [Aerococcus kribbianus]|uniref:DUF1836 domain-containing protein n=2 Tax=Aerococcus kribbianus TaxID=2999064 RepID=A0A9X3FUZ2_9LACT|nr:DUF1836 domain-containing protein [Aerococcus sp. YH-aer222]MCZ0725002.1 DUF1836 domain-containing protein [Aerococcus sp. YH-aer222]
MMKNKSIYDGWIDEMASFQLPRWNELSSVPLYMDQLLALVKDYLKSFRLQDTSNMEITPAMVNNYVKLGLMPKPEKKRYYRRHIAYLIIITLFKQAISIQEIRKVLVYLAASHGNEQAYNLFCTYLETSVRKECHYYQTGEFTYENGQAYKDPDHFDHYIIWNACSLITHLIFSRRLIECLSPEDLVLDEQKISS